MEKGIEEYTNINIQRIINTLIPGWTYKGPTEPLNNNRNTEKQERREIGYYVAIL